MNNETLLDYVAPCSLLCYTCTGFGKGPVTESARKLHCYLEGFGEMRGAHMSGKEQEDWLAYFDGFRNTLTQICGTCPGCRKGPGDGCIEGCVIPACVRERGVAFCAECGVFPCEKARDFFAAYDERIGRVWEAGSRRLREVGPEAYFKEKRHISHYMHYKEE